MTTIHTWIGVSIVAAFALLSVYGMLGRLFGRAELGRPFWGLLYYTETVLVVQIVAGVILLVMGRRVVASTGFHLHYVYGSVLPLIAVIGGRLYSLRREEHQYVPIALGAFVAFGLTARALMTANWSLG